MRSTLTHCVSVSVNARTSQISALRWGDLSVAARVRTQIENACASYQLTCMLYLIAMAARPGLALPVAAAKKAATPMLPVPTAPEVQNISQRLIPQFIRYDA